MEGLQARSGAEVTRMKRGRRPIATTAALLGIARNWFVSIVVAGVTCAAEAQSDTLPMINRRIVDFVDAHMGRKVDRGECWDLAAAALDSAGATWDHQLRFGRSLDPDKEVVLPGDIIQLEGVEFKWLEGDATHTVNMPHHTVIVHAVKERGQYVVAQQNMQGIGRKVGLGELVLAHRCKGRILIFRPVQE